MRVLFCQASGENPYGGEVFEGDFDQLPNIGDEVMQVRAGGGNPKFRVMDRRFCLGQRNETYAALAVERIDLATNQTAMEAAKTAPSQTPAAPGKVEERIYKPPTPAEVREMAKGAAKPVDPGVKPVLS